jgi:multidrug efflux pump subunit AcrB
VDQDTSLEDNFAQVSYSIDAKKALASGVNTHQVTTTLKGVLEGGAVTQYHLPHQNEMAFIFVRFPKDKRDEVLDLKNIHMKNKNGEMIPLSSLVLEKVQKEPQVFYNDKRERTEYISAEISGRSVVYAVIDLLQEFIFRPPQTLNGAQFVSKNWNLYRIEYHYDNGETVSIEWGGEFEMTLDNFRDLGIAMFFAFLLIYVVLVAQFRSFLRPALIMVTIPLAFIGILPGFAILDFVNGTFLTATSLIGFIALMGIVVNNAILYLEYVEQLICKGKEKQEALIEAGKTRLRPIMLTSLTTVLGSLTIASDPVWSGLAFSIVFGLSLSTVLTLIVFPVLYNMTLSLQKSEQCFL